MEGPAPRGHLLLSKQSLPKKNENGLSAIMAKLNDII